MEELVKTALPNFRYQLQLSSGEVEKHIVSKEQIRQFLQGAYGGRGPNGEVAFTAEEGIQYRNLPNIGASPLLTDKVGHVVVMVLRVANSFRC